MHRRTPDQPLPRDGEPYPDEARHHLRPRPKRPRDRDLVGADIARVLDAHFADPTASPSGLADRFHGLWTPLHPNAHIAVAARRAETRRVREAGRWLVRYGTDRCAVTVGLGLLAAVGTVADIPRIQTIGLLSCVFGALAADALERLPGGAEALMWLSERMSGWGLVYGVEALCRLVDDHPGVRPWLLRRAVEGDTLSGYVAGRVACAAGLHEAVGEFGDDTGLVDHTTRLLHVMTECDGMGMTLCRYVHAVPVLEAHVRHLGRLGPTAERCFSVAVLAHYLTTERPAGSAEPGTESRWQAIRDAYLALLDREDWCATARQGAAAGDDRFRWLAGSVADELGLRAFRADRRRRPGG
ncbi:hypothetical protein HUT19_10810 [Streptomyces sp. NA02950]|nr:hypothetical protein HUT19_10810 [Streptomyces sp. NA02950]